MTPLIPIVIAGAVFAFSGGSGKSKSKTDPKVYAKCQKPMGYGPKAWNVIKYQVDKMRTVDSSVVYKDFEYYAMGLALNESVGSNLVANGEAAQGPPWVSYPNDTDDAGARTGFQRNPKTFGPNPYSYDDWTFGSGGFYGMLPSSAFGWLKHRRELSSSKNLSPLDVFDPYKSTVLLHDLTRRIMQTKQFLALPKEHRTWIAVRRGHGSLELIKDIHNNHPASQRLLSRYDDLAQAGIIPKDFAHRVVPSINDDAWKEVFLEMYFAYSREVPSAYLEPECGMGNYSGKPIDQVL